MTTLYIYDKYQEKINLDLKYYCITTGTTFLFCLILPLKMRGGWNWFVITGTSVAWVLMQVFKKVKSKPNKSEP